MLRQEGFSGDLAWLAFMESLPGVFCPDFNISLPNFFELSSYTNNFIAFFCTYKLCQGTELFFDHFWPANVAISWDSAYICDGIRLNVSNLLKLWYPIIVFLKFILSNLSPTENVSVLFYQMLLFQIIFPRPFFFQVEFYFFLIPDFFWWWGHQFHLFALGSTPNSFCQFIYSFLHVIVEK